MEDSLEKQKARARTAPLTAPQPLANLASPVGTNRLLTCVPPRLRARCCHSRARRYLEHDGDGIFGKPWVWIL